MNKEPAVDADSWEVAEGENRLLSLLEETTDASRRIDLLSELASHRAIHGDTEVYLETLDLALRETERVPVDRRRAELLNEQGRARRLIGNPDGAESSYLSALEIARQFGHGDAEATSLNNLGRLYHSQGRMEPALDCYQAALSRWRELGQREKSATTLENLASSLSLMGRLNEARNLLEQALEIRRSSEDHKGAAVALTELGWVHFQLGEPARAIPYYEAALEAYAVEPDRLGRAGTLDRLGSAYRQLHRFGEAHQTYRVAEEILASGGFRIGLAHTRANLCELYVDWGRPVAALDLCRESGEVFRQSGDRHALAHVFYNSARAMREQGDLDGSWTAIQKALGLVEELWTEAPSRSIRAAYIATRHIYIEEVVRLLMRRHHAAPNEGFDLQALQIVDRYRGRNYLEALLDRLGDAKGVPSLLGRETRLRDRISALAVQLERPTASRRLEDELRDLLRRREWMASELGSLRSASELARASEWTLEEIQQDLRQARSALVVYFLTADESFVWWITPDRFGNAGVSGRNELESTARAVLTLTSSGGPTSEIQLGLAIRRLSADLLGPMVGQLDGEQLIVIADGILNYVPFGLLGRTETETGDARWRELVQDYEIRHVPSIAVDRVLVAQTGAVNRDSPDLMAVLADPVFSDQDERLVGRVARLPDRKEPLLARLELTTGIKEWPRLPASEKEAEAILSLLPAGRALRALGLDANREMVLAGRLNTYRILHFATHSLIIDSYPELSGIVLSLVDSEGRRVDGYLRVQDIVSLDLDADLVVLSACRTALGGSARGEGIVGLGRAFLEAGARDVVVSLWDVDDAATAVLMTRFYSSLIEDGLSPTAALRRAQLSMARENTWSHPRYWSGFVIVGGS